MRIDGSFPMHIARAYGVADAKQAHAAHKHSPSSQSHSRPVGPLGNPSLAPASVTPTSAISKLLAGKVSQPIDFNTTHAPSVRPRGDALPLYTRAADRVEAATSIQIGREIDVRG